MSYYITVNTRTNQITNLYSDQTGYATPVSGAIPITDVNAEIVRTGFYKYQYVNGSIVPYTLPIESTALEPNIAIQLAVTEQITVLTNAYDSAIVANISYMGTSFQADTASQSTLTSVLSAANGSLPPNFYWVDITNNQIPMNITQLKGLADAIFSRGWTAFQHLQTLKSEVRNATAAAQVSSIVW